MAEEFDLVEKVLWSDANWRAAMAKRGLTDPARIRVSALSAGVFGLPGEEGRRLVRCLSFLQLNNDDNVWAHPIDGIVAYVDLISCEVIELIDDGAFDIPLTPADFHLDDPARPARTSQQPIEITQPEGPSFTVDGNQVNWEKWQFRIGFDRSKASRSTRSASRTADASGRSSTGRRSPRWWFRTGIRRPCASGRTTSTPASTRSARTPTPSSWAATASVRSTTSTPPSPTTMGAAGHHQRNLHARGGLRLLWKHTDMYNGAASTRRQRRLVISFFITIGNYDYGFYWYLYLDGTIELECKATGVVFASAYPGPRATRPTRGRARSRPASVRRSTSTCSRPGWT